MALPIKSIPELTGEAAERFIKVADSTKKGTIDFTKEMENSRKILEKSVEQINTIIPIALSDVHFATKKD